MGRLSVCRLWDPKWVPRVPANKIINLTQAFWKRFSLSPARVIYEAKSGKPQCANLGPLLIV